MKISQYYVDKTWHNFCLALVTKVVDQASEMIRNSHSFIERESTNAEENYFTLVNNKIGKQRQLDELITKLNNCYNLKKLIFESLILHGGPSQCSIVWLI